VSILTKVYQIFVILCFEISCITYIYKHTIGKSLKLLNNFFFFFRVHTTSSAETVRSCLDVIAICSVVPKVMLLLCERVDMPDMSMTMAINLLLAAAECEIIADADVQRAALRAVINCVCAPINRVRFFI